MTNEINAASQLQGGQAQMVASPTEPRQQRLFNAPRCHAHARTGMRCRCPAVKGKAVCRAHGGAKGSGGQRGERNGAFKHGGWTNEAVAVRREAAALLRVIRQGVDA